MYYVYLLENQNDKSFYIGYTKNLKQRFREHIKGYGCRTTRLKDSWKLIYFFKWEFIPLKIKRKLEGPRFYHSHFGSVRGRLSFTH